MIITINLILTMTMVFFVLLIKKKLLSTINMNKTLIIKIIKQIILIILLLQTIKIILF
jgi:hypothetical protein